MDIFIVWCEEGDHREDGAAEGPNGSEYQSKRRCPGDFSMNSAVLSFPASAHTETFDPQQHQSCSLMSKETAEADRVQQRPDSPSH